jgi:hypothetical protein
MVLEYGNMAPPHHCQLTQLTVGILNDKSWRVLEYVLEYHGRSHTIHHRPGGDGVVEVVTPVMVPQGRRCPEQSEYVRACNVRTRVRTPSSVPKKERTSPFSLSPA